MTDADPSGGLSWAVYTSTATARFDDARLAALLAQSRTTNRAREVTGLLLYRDRRFLQALEGPSDTVRDLVELIATDPRHHDVEVILDEPIAERRFPSWAMGYASWSGSAGRLPAAFLDVFDDLTVAARSDDAIRTVRGLMEWFRHRDWSDDDLDAEPATVI